MAWLHDRGELGLGEVFTHRKVDKELACFQLINNIVKAKVFGSDRSPRRGNVCLCVYVSVIMLKHR